MKRSWFEKGKIQKEKLQNRKFQNKEQGISMVALVVTIVLNSSYLAMARMNRFEKI